MTPKVFLLHPTSGDLFELPYNSISYIEELNNGASATFEFDYQTIKDQVCAPYNTNPKDLFTAVFTEIWVDNGSGSKIFYGVISDYQRSRNATGTYQLTIAAIDYFSLFQKRRSGSDDTFTAVDPATIPWSLISVSQAKTHGSFGITVGATTVTGLSVTANYKYADIRQSITDLSNFKVQGSFDVDIDYTKKLNIYFPAKGSLRSNIIFDENTILAHTVNIPVLPNITNSIFVTGQGINNDVAKVNVQSADAVIAEYGLLEDVISDTQVSDTTILSAEGSRFLALHQLPLYAITLKHAGDDIDITTYGLGDTVIVNIAEEQISYAQFRVKKRTVDIDLAGTLTATLDLLTI